MKIPSLVHLNRWYVVGQYALRAIFRNCQWRAPLQLGRRRDGARKTQACQPTNPIPFKCNNALVLNRLANCMLTCLQLTASHVEPCSHCYGVVDYLGRWFCIKRDLFASVEKAKMIDSRWMFQSGFMVALTPCSRTLQPTIFAFYLVEVSLVCTIIDHSAVCSTTSRGTAIEGGRLSSAPHWFGDQTN